MGPNSLKNSIVSTYTSDLYLYIFNENTKQIAAVGTISGQMFFFVQSRTRL